MINYDSVKLNEIWQKSLEIIKMDDSLDDATFAAWFQTSTTLYSLEDNASISYFATIVVPFSVNRDIVMQFSDLINMTLSSILEKEVTSQIICSKELELFDNDSFLKKKNNIIEDKINPNFTFDNFVVGNNNREAHASALSVCHYPGQFNNPLFIFGNSGLGKTHLLHSIANHVKENKKDSKVFYMYSEDFVTLLIEGMKNKSVESIKDQISECDYFLIDDIQRLKHNTSQEIFFNVYNRLINDRKQIVITSDIHPTELKGIEDRLISRFSSGLSVSVSSPEFETAKAILQKKIEGRQDEIIVEDSVLDFIATKFAADVRQLEGALNELFFKAIMYNPESINLEFVKDIFKENPITFVDDELNVTQIKKGVCEYYGLTKLQIESKSRTQHIANARHIAIYLCRKLLNLPYAQIGLEFGNRDHSTVISSCEKMTKLIKEKDSFKQAILQIENKFTKN